MKKNRLELLAPAGSYEGMRLAYLAGADAVYVGGQRFGARAYAHNFTEEELLRSIDEAHLHGKSLYLTVNTLMKDQELEKELYSYLKPLYMQGLDAVIVQDLGVLSFIRRNFPDLPIHASTQMTVTGPDGAQFLQGEGVSRVVTARELSLEELRAIYDRTGMEIECFVHGALCYCYSGQCLLSSLIGGRSGNRGRCAQPCRLPYEALGGEGTAGKEKPYLLSPKDICTLSLLPELAESGVYSLKIEGRMKRPEYTAGVTAIYRKYVDRYLESGRAGYQVEPEDKKRLELLYSRGSFSEGYLKQHNGRTMITLKKPSYNDKNKKLLDEIREDIEHSGFPKKKIKGNLILFPGECAKLELECGAVRAAVSGDAVQEALRQPMSEDRVLKQIKKTGGTPFAFEELNVCMGEHIFLPVQSLNELRREGLTQLYEALMGAFRRPLPGEAASGGQPGGDVGSTAVGQGTHTPSLRVYVEEEDYIPFLKDIPEIDAFYLDSHAAGLPRDTARLSRLIRTLHEAGKKCYLALPRIFRNKTACVYEKLKESLFDAGLDGMLIRNLEELHFLLRLGYEGEIISDFGLYTMNREAMRFLKSRGVCRMCAPLELNEKELLIRGMEHTELPVYGYAPVMVSAQCIKKTLGSCQHKSDSLFLKDRMNKKFCVKNYCEECYNVIYNTAPLSLLGLVCESLALKPEGIRLDFTIEDPREAAAVTKEFIRAFYKAEPELMPTYDFTRGHFKRGIE